LAAKIDAPDRRLAANSSRSPKNKNFCRLQSGIKSTEPGIAGILAKGVSPDD
jgi:hypothetical protein